MNVSIIFDQDDGYICFVKGVRNIIGYGDTEKACLLDFLKQCEDNPLFNTKVVSSLLQKLQ